MEASAETGLGPLPRAARTARPRDLFTLWFGANMMLLTIATGAMAPRLYHLPPLAAFAAILLGNALGGVVMGLHSAQGARLGVPQMVQARGQFGRLGALPIAAIVLLMYVGFFSSNLVLASQALRVLGLRAPPLALIGLAAAGSGLAALAGPTLLQRAARLMSTLSALALLAAFALLAWRGLPAPSFPAAFDAAAFLRMFAIGALWQIACAPYVSDYSRYLPAEARIAPVFLASYLGSFAGTLLPMTLGALIGNAPGADVIGALGNAFGPPGLVIAAIFTLGIVSSNALNLYGGSVSALVLGEGLALSRRAWGRGRLTLLIALIGVGLAGWGAGDFWRRYSAFLSLLLYALVPWTAVNLSDFYLIRRGVYDPALFGRAGGIRLAPAAAFAYLAGLSAELLARLIGEGRGIVLADIAWAVGFAVAAFALLLWHGGAGLRIGKRRGTA
jgi:NCS1 family nucleobase:cation symporter-1